MAALIAYLALALVAGAVIGVEAQYHRPLTPAEAAELDQLAGLNTGYLMGPW